MLLSGSPYLTSQYKIADKNDQGERKDLAGPSNVNTVPLWLYCFRTWVEQMESMLRAQGLDVVSKVDFVLWGLDGVTKRQVMLLDADKRGSSRAILDKLKRLYGLPSFPP